MVEKYEVVMARYGDGRREKSMTALGKKYSSGENKATDTLMSKLEKDAETVLKKVPANSSGWREVTTILEIR